MTKQIKKILPDIQNHYLFKDYDFKLIGGTALAYHLKHRLSEDLDFCRMGKLPREAIEDFIKYCVNVYGRNKVTFIEFTQGKLLDFEINCEDILKYEQNWMINHVKVTFFDGSDNRGVKDIFDADKPTKVGNIEIASVDSIFAMKSLMFYNRAKSRDYYDLFFLFNYNNAKYSINKTLLLIQQYELIYQDYKGLEFFIERIKNANYSKMYDEPLVGLVDQPEEFPILQKRMIALLNSLVV